MTQPEIKRVTVTTSSPVRFNHWGPHFEDHMSGALLAKPVAKWGGEHAYLTKTAAALRAEDLLKIAREDEAVFLVTVDHRESDLDSVTYYVCGPLEADAFGEEI